MRVFNIHAAKTHLSRLVDAAAAGEEILIAKAGKPMALLSPAKAEPVAKRRLGGLRGKFELPPNFDDPLPEDILAALEGRK